MARDSRFLRRPSGRPRRSLFVRILRTTLLALFFALLFGFVVGTFLRRELDHPVRYMGEFRWGAPMTLGLRYLHRASLPDSVGAADPGEIGEPLPRVFVSRDHEEEIG